MKPHSTKAMPSTKTWYVYTKDTFCVVKNSLRFKIIQTRRDTITYGRDKHIMSVLVMIAKNRANKWIGKVTAVKWGQENKYLMEGLLEYNSAEEAVKAVDDCCKEYAETYEDIEIIEKVLDNLFIE